MLRMLGSHKTLCDGISRRDLLQVGGASLLGLSLADLEAVQAKNSQEPASGGSFGKAKNCILLFLYGGVSQLDTFDPKPEASPEIRGPFGSISTAIPGVKISETLPRLAKNLDRVTLIRSMSHPHPIHGVAYAVTGIGRVDIPMELNRKDPRHWPYFGSVLDHLSQRDSDGEELPSIPHTIHLPWDLSSRSAPHKRAGLLGGFLGARYNPTVLEFEGRATNSETYRPSDPYGGVDSDGRFRFASTEIPAELTLDRLNRRQDLLEQFDAQRKFMTDRDQGQSLDYLRQAALAMVGKSKMREALDLNREPEQLRQRYGYHLFGQSALLARRMIEAGSRLVSVFWDEFGRSCGAWDAHEKLNSRMKGELCPGFDQTFDALLDDLDQRGMLDETLVVVMTEHGRTPKAERRGNSFDGRGHWSRNYCNMLAGAGVAQGNVIGASNSLGNDVLTQPISPKDMLSTIYHLLGVDSRRMIRDHLDRPIPIVDHGSVLRAALA